MTEEQIARINELYHKSKSEQGLTEEEKQEQTELRQQYLQSVRRNLKTTLDHTVVEYPDGTVKSIKEAGIKYAGIQ